jgi:hypothetical protein
VSKSAMIGGRVEQSIKDRLVGLKDVLSRKTRLPITETCILETLIETADVRELAQLFSLKS